MLRSGLWVVADLVPIRTSALTPIALVLRRLDEDPHKALLARRLRPIQAYCAGDGRHDHAYVPPAGEDAGEGEEDEDGGDRES